MARRLIRVREVVGKLEVAEDLGDVGGHVLDLAEGDRRLVDSCLRPRMDARQLIAWAAALVGHAVHGDLAVSEPPHRDHERS